MRIKRHILPDEERYVFYLQKADGAKMFREKMGKAVVFFMQFVRFGLVGAVNSAINYFIYAVCIKAGMHYIGANVVGFMLTIFSAYLLQSKFVFKECGKSLIWWKVLLKTYVSYAFTGLLLTNVLSILWIDILDLSTVLYPIYTVLDRYFKWPDIFVFIKYMAPVLNTLFSIPINFLINKYWAYRETES